MNILPKAISKLIESFEKLPGVGTKTASRFAFYLLHMPEEELAGFADNVRNLKANTVLCSVCRNVAENDPCMICSNPGRDHSVICVVEQPTDVLTIERTGKYKGLYHVLHGAIDPLNNIGPDEIFIKDLLKRLTSRESRVAEIILATNPNMEGEATAMFIHKRITQVPMNSQHPAPKVTRLAHGLPVGADIEYADEMTLTRALEGRREF